MRTSQSDLSLDQAALDAYRAHAAFQRAAMQCAGACMTLLFSAQATWWGMFLPRPALGIVSVAVSQGGMHRVITAQPKSWQR